MTNTRPSVQAHTAILARLFVGCINEVLSNVGVHDRLEADEVPANLASFVERLRNDTLEEAYDVARMSGASLAARRIRALKDVP